MSIIVIADTEAVGNDDAVRAHYNWWNAGVCVVSSLWSFAVG
jgi:hypothetical protein